MRSRIVLCAALLALSFSSASIEPIQLIGSRAPVDKTYFGLHLHRAHSTTPWPPAPFGTLRLWDAGVSWERLEPVKGQWQFDRLDKLISLSEKNGVEPLLTLGITPRWASARPGEDFVYGKGGRAEPADIADWERYVRTVAGRYKGRIRYYELWNEPTFTELEQNKGFYSGSAEKMVELARVARRVLRKIDPDIRMLTPGFTDDGRRLDLFLRLGGKEFTDIVSYHFYSPRPEAMAYRVSQIRAVMASHGIADRELWNTEYGFEMPPPGKPMPAAGVRDETDLAAYVARSLVLGVALGIQRFYWYSWDHGTMGLLDKSSLLPNVAGLAYIQAGRWLRGATLRECRSEDRKRWICELKRGERHAWIIWHVAGESAWNPPAEWAVRDYETLAGQFFRPAAGVPLAIGPSPILVKSDAAPWAPER